MSHSTETAVARRPTDFTPPAWLDTLQRRALVAGVIGAAASIAGLFLAPEQFYRSYLVGFLYWFGVALGCTGLMMLNHLTGGGWGIVVRRVFEAASRTLPLLVLLFVPVVLGMTHLYPWTNPEIVEHSEILQSKQAWLNTTFFIGRAAFYFLVWIVFMLVLNRWSLRQDETADPRLARRMSLLSAAGVVAYVLTGTFAAFDWLMSLDPLWFSSLFGLHFIVGQGISAFAFIILVAIRLMRTEPMSRVLGLGHFDDYGKLMFAFTLLWIYMTFSQFLIIWSGNLPEEITWYVTRRSGGYWEWSVVMLALHWVLPFFVLLSRRLRKNPRVIGTTAFIVLFGHWLDLYWQAMPSMEGQLALHWLDAALPLGVGGFWLAAFAWQMKRRACVPIHDPAFEGAIGHA